MKTLDEVKSTIVAHREEMAEKYKVREIGVFGSYVRGEQREDSDIDILVDFHVTNGLLELSELRLDLIDWLGMEVDIVPKPDIRKELREMILKEAVTIWRAA